MRLKILSAKSWLSGLDLNMLRMHRNLMYFFYHDNMDTLWWKRYAQYHPMIIHIYDSHCVKSLVILYRYFLSYRPRLPHRALEYGRPCAGEATMTYTWRRHQMEIFSALLAICTGNSPVSGEFPAQRPATRSFDAFFDLRLGERLGKHSWGWWWETPSRPLRRQSNGSTVVPVPVKQPWRIWKNDNDTDNRKRGNKRFHMHGIYKTWKRKIETLVHVPQY